jgi:hypothetical protein
MLTHSYFLLNPNRSDMMQVIQKNEFYGSHDRVLKKPDNHHLEELTP